MSSERQAFQNYAQHQTLRDIWQEKKTGVFTIWSGNYEKSLYFRDGVVVFGASDDPDDKLPRIFMDHEIFSQDQYESVLPNFRDDISVGRNLVEVGLITQQQLVQGAKDQVFSIFKRVLANFDGEMQFDEQNLPEGIVQLPLKFPDHFLKALLTIDDRAWLSAHFGADLNFMCRPLPDQRADFSKMDVADFADEVYGLIDGEKDFNHLAFEAEIDDFLLLKFLYALDLLGYVAIDIEAREDEEEDQPSGGILDEDDEEIPDLRATFSDTLAHGDEIDQLGKLSMDETVELGGVKHLLGDEAMGSMENTMEIPRSALKDSDEPIAQGGWEEDFDEPEAEEEEELENEDQGLDDLERGGDDLLEMELEKMNAPLKEIEDMAVQIQSEESEDAYEDEEEEPGQKKRRFAFALPGLAALRDKFSAVSPVKGKGTALALGGILLLLIGLTWVNRDAITQYYADLVVPTDLSLPQLSEEDAALVDGTPDPAETEAVVADDEPVTAVAEVDSGSETADPTAENNELQAQAETPPPLKNEPPVETRVDETTPALTDSARQNTANDETFYQKNGFHSPIMENWDPKKSPPPVTGNQTATRRSESNKQPETRTRRPTTEPKPVPAQPEVKRRTTEQERAATAKPTTKPAQNPTNTPRSTVATAVAAVLPDQRNALQAGRYSESAVNYRTALQDNPEVYTVRMFLACEKSSVDKVVAEMGSDPNLFILAKTYQGRECYWVCYGLFDSRRAALISRKNFPGEYAGGGDAKSVGEML